MKVYFKSSILYLKQVYKDRHDLDREEFQKTKGLLNRETL